MAAGYDFVVSLKGKNTKGFLLENRKNLKRIYISLYLERDPFKAFN